MNKYYKDVYNEVRRNKKKTDIQYRLLSNHRLFIYKCVTKYKMDKTKKSIEYLGIGTKTLKKWLEFQFEPDMTWENYGDLWTIDHILPLSLFDLTDKKQQQIAFNWTNLQPLKDNFSKSNKIRQYEYFNVVVSVHRFIKNNNLNSKGYQNLNESLNWLREKLRYGKNSTE